MEGRAAVLGSHRNARFYGTACGSGRYAHLAFAVSSTGNAYLTDAVYDLCPTGCLLSFARRKLTKTEELCDGPVHTVVATEKHVMCGLETGEVVFLNPSTLQKTSSMSAEGSSPCVALAVDPARDRLVLLMADGELRWCSTSTNKIDGRLNFHHGPVWGVDSYDQSNATSSKLSEDTFATCGADDTIRFWKLNGTLGMVI